MVLEVAFSHIGAKFGRAPGQCHVPISSLQLISGVLIVAVSDKPVIAPVVKVGPLGQTNSDISVLIYSSDPLKIIG
jgi:hypothetical protein